MSTITHTDRNGYTSRGAFMYQISDGEVSYRGRGDDPEHAMQQFAAGYDFEQADKVDVVIQTIEGIPVWRETIYRRWEKEPEQ